MMSNKKIIIGDIIGDWCQTADNVNYNINQQYTPVDVFKEVVRLYKSKKDFTLYTNNPQLIEAIEVLYTESDEEPDIELYLSVDNYSELIRLYDFREAYNYLSAPYDIIDTIRLLRGMKIDETEVFKEIDEWLQKTNIAYHERVKEGKYIRGDDIFVRSM